VISVTASVAAQSANMARIVSGRMCRSPARRRAIAAR
jgi:hypothetical protein